MTLIGIRTIFSNDRLIYARKRDQWGWYKSTDCLWSSTTSIRGKVTLDDDYEDLKSFFVDFLGVRLLTLQLLYDELRQTKEHQDTAELRIALSVFSSLLGMADASSLDPNPIRNASIFPVRYCSGPVVLRSADTDFAIGDRDYLREKFQDKITMLEFDLVEVRRFKPLIEWLGITDRYLSNCVQEFTSVSDTSGNPILSGPRDLKRKAHHILRYTNLY